MGLRQINMTSWMQGTFDHGHLMVKKKKRKKIIIILRKEKMNMINFKFKN